MPALFFSTDIAANEDPSAVIGFELLLLLDEDNETMANFSLRGTNAKRSIATALTASKWTSLSSSTNKHGKWEQHTRGIASKIMESMGHEPGLGLGRDTTGITDPLEVRFFVQSS